MVTLREFQSTDGPVLRALMVASLDADGVDLTTEDEERLDRYLADAPSQAVEVTVAEDDREVVGFSLLAERIDVIGTLSFDHLCHVTPHRRRGGVGSALLGALQDRARRRIHRRGPSQVGLHALVVDRQQGAVELLQRAGYVAVHREAHMVRRELDAVAELPLPAGLVVRRPSPDELRRIWEAQVASDREIAERYVEPTDADFARWQQARPGPDHG